MFSLVPFLTAGLRFTPAVARRAVMARVLETRMPDVQAREWILDELRSGDPAAIAEAAGAISRYSSHEWISDVDVPTAVVVTEQDRLVPPHRQRKLAESIPGSRVVPVAGDHGVCVADPRAFVPALMNACSMVVAASSTSARPAGRY